MGHGPVQAFRAGRRRYSDDRQENEEGRVKPRGGEPFPAEQEIEHQGDRRERQGEGIPSERRRPRMDLLLPRRDDATGYTLYEIAPRGCYIMAERVGQLPLPLGHRRHNGIGRPGGDPPIHPQQIPIARDDAYEPELPESIGIGQRIPHLPHRLHHLVVVAHPHFGHARRSGAERLDDLSEPPLLDGDRLDDLYAEPFTELLRIYGYPPLAGLVHHVENEDRAAPQLRQLRGEQERAKEILRIGDLNDRRIAVPDEYVPRDPLVLSLREEGIDAGGVYHLQRTVEPGLSAGDLDGRSRIVRDDRVTARQIGEYYALADVGVSDQVDSMVTLPFGHDAPE